MKIVCYEEFRSWETFLVESNRWLLQLTKYKLNIVLDDDIYIIYNRQCPLFGKFAWNFRHRFDLYNNHSFPYSIDERRIRRQEKNSPFAGLGFGFEILI